MHEYRSDITQWGFYGRMADAAAASQLPAPRRAVRWPAPETAAEAAAEAESDALMVAHGAGYVSELAAMLWGDQEAEAAQLGRLDVRYLGAVWATGHTWRPAAPHSVVRVDIDASPATDRWCVALSINTGPVETFHADGATIGDAIADTRRRLASRGYTES